jgi:uncharacterized membrane protein required for colicin V production
MIAAATVHAPAAAAKLSFDWFDFVLIAILGFGLFRGRRNGMAKELIPFFQWIALVVVCGLFYEPVGQLFINIMQMGVMWGDILGYVILALVVYLVFALIKKPFAKKLEGSNMFGGSEYYLGMLAGIIRFFCILLAGLALLNAPVYTAAEIAAHAAYVQKNYGGGLQGFSGGFFPTIQEVQEAVFEKSFTGPYIKEYLNPVLIDSGSPNAKKPGAKTVAKPGVKPPAK